MAENNANHTKKRGSIGYEALRAVMVTWFGLTGWKMTGAVPEGQKFVVIAAPHTSNWDFPLMLAITLHWRIDVRWMGKDTLFTTPVLGAVLRRLGGISIDRSMANNVVDQMVAEFAGAENLIMVIPPEGTRGKVKYWKSGFYHIAHQAQVPILLGFLDYEKKLGGIESQFVPSGDYDKDMQEIKAFYNTVKGKHPDLGVAN